MDDIKSLARTNCKYHVFAPKDVKAFTSALKPIYKAPTEESALAALSELEDAWGTKYPAAIRS